MKKSKKMNVKTISAEDVYWKAISPYLSKRYNSMSELDTALKSVGITMHVGLYPSLEDITSVCPAFKTLGEIRNGTFVLNSVKVNAVLGQGIYRKGVVINGFLINVLIDKLLEEKK